MSAAGSHSHLAGAAVELAHAAGEVVSRYFRQHPASLTKQDASPVTVADREAEALIRDEINRRFTDHGIIGEEFGVENPDAEWVWVIDPIDGTKAFLAGKPTFGVLLAVVQRGVPVVGVLHQPILGETWVGNAGNLTLFLSEKGSPSPRPSPGGRGGDGMSSSAFIQDSVLGRSKQGDDASPPLPPGEGRGEGLPLHTSGCDDLKQAILSTTSPTLFTPPQKTAFDRVAAAVRFVDYGGDCYNYGLLAMGQVDLVIENGLKFHDVAALIPIVEGAGGVVSQWDGARVTLDGFDGSFIAAANHDLASAARGMLKG